MNNNLNIIDQLEPEVASEVAQNNKIESLIHGVSGPDAVDSNNNPAGTPPKVQENCVSETEKQDQDNAALEQTVEVPIPAIQLTEKDIKKLEKLEAKVKNAVVEGWKALAEIQHYEGGRLWKINYPSFEDYVAARFDFNRKHSMRLVEAGRFLLLLDKGKSKGPQPTRESHIREITQKLPEDHRVDFWDKFCEERSITDKSIHEITAKQVKKAVIEYRKDIPKEDFPAKAPREKKLKVPGVEKIRAKSLLLLEKVKVQVKEHPNQDSILEKLEELIELINN